MQQQSMASTMAAYIVEKSFNQLLESYRAEVLPSVVKGWQELTTQEQTQISHLNNFFCGLHLIVGMADTAATTLMEWEEVGTFSHVSDVTDRANYTNVGDM